MILKKYNSISIILSTTIFLISFLVGLSSLLPTLNHVNFIYPQNYSLVRKVCYISFSYILLNNIKLLLVQIFGCFLFGIPTFLVETYNALFFGYLIKYCAIHGLSLNIIFLLLLPHGIFEIPAIIIAGAAGFKIPYEIIRYLAGKKETVLTREDIKEYLTLALISVILVVIAAWIEANVTLRIAKAMLNSAKGI